MKRLLIGLMLVVGASQAHADTFSADAGRCITFLAMGKQLTQSRPDVQSKIDYMANAISNIGEEKQALLDERQMRAAAEEYKNELMRLAEDARTEQLSDQTKQGIQQWVDRGANSCVRIIS